MATVSNALNGRQGVSREICSNILQLADEMGYQHHRKSNVKPYARLVVLLRDGQVVGETQFFAELTQGIERGCQEENVELMISQLRMNGSQEYLDKVNEICSEECKGILLIATEMGHEDIILYQRCASPLLVIDNLFENEKVHSVVMDNYHAGMQATQALLDAGHIQIGHITSSVNFSNMRYRQQGFEAVLTAAGLSASPENIWRVTPTLDGAYQDAKHILESKVILPTAFFAGNDIIAVGCMRALLEAGYHIPEQVSIIGMDDTSICRVINPALSSVRVYRHEMGKEAVTQLLHAVPKARRSILKIQLSTDLVLRKSICGPRSEPLTSGVS